MTLILSFVSPNFAVVVADRMLTSIVTGAKMKNPATKLVQYCNKMIFGFMGLAELEGKTTDNWLATEITKCPERNFNVLAKQIMERARQACEGRDLAWLPPEKRILAFVGAGFTGCAESRTYHSTLIRISNCYDESGYLYNANRTFSLERTVYKTPIERTWDWVATGAILTSKEKKDLTRLLIRCSKKGVGPAPVIRLFKDTIRRVSDRLTANKDLSVGKDLLAGAIPLAATKHDESTMASADFRGGITLGGTLKSEAHPRNEMPLYLDIPEGTNVGIQRLPVPACPGSGITFSKFTITPRP